MNEKTIGCKNRAGRDRHEPVCIHHSTLTTQHSNGTNTLEEYVYDYKGRRIAKETTTHATEDEEYRVFFYHGWNVAAEQCDRIGNILDGGREPAARRVRHAMPCMLNQYTTDSSWANEDLDFTYTWGLDLSGSLQGAGGVGGLLVAEKVSTGNTGEYYPTYDGNGNVSEYIDSSGAQVAHYEYDPFGNELSLSSGTLKDLFNFKFSTKYEDKETGFYYYGYRYYDAVAGRWTRRDPIGESGGINLYRFVYNDGVNQWDYLGLDAESDGWNQINPFSQSLIDWINGDVPKKPKPVDINIGDGNIARGWAKSNENGTFQDMINIIKKEMSKGNRCVCTLILAFHGNPNRMNVNQGGPTSPPTNRSSDTQKANIVTKDNASDLFSSMSKQIKFCKPCTIKLYSCNVGLGEIPQKIAQATGCEVWAAKGYCYVPTNKNKDHIKIDPDPKDIKPHYPGGKHGWGVFRKK